VGWTGTPQVDHLMSTKDLIGTTEDGSPTAFGLTCQYGTPVPPKDEEPTSGTTWWLWNKHWIVGKITLPGKPMDLRWHILLIEVT